MLFIWPQAALIKIFQLNCATSDAAQRHVSLHPSLLVSSVHFLTSSFPCTIEPRARLEVKRGGLGFDSSGSWVGSDNWLEKKGSQEENSSGLQSRMAFLTLPSERRILGRACRPADAGFKGAFGLKNGRQACEGRFRVARECVSRGALWRRCET